MREPFIEYMKRIGIPCAHNTGLPDVEIIVVHYNRIGEITIAIGMSFDRIESVYELSIAALQDE